jgi:D-alanyl-D-alanine carboxypeptidase
MRPTSEARNPCARGTIRILAAFAAICVLFGAAAEARAAGKHAALVVDANSGRMLFAQAADEPRYPASLTKMMTLYIVFELMQQGRLQASTRIAMSAAAAGTAPSKLGLEEGATIALGDAIKALITKSANDVAVAVAEHVAGSEEKFARLMTQKARSLGMPATVFKNAHGLPHPEQITTARDMVTLALRLNDDFPRYYPLFATRTFSYDGDTYRNHNTLLDRFEGVDGIKTGYTAASGFNLVSSVRRDGKHVVAAVFGGVTAGRRNATMRALLTRALTQAATQKTRRPQLIAKSAPADERMGRPLPQLVEPIRPAAAVRAEPDPGQQPVRGGASDPAEDTVGPGPSRAPNIQIARVRPVLVAPRARTDEPSPARPVTLASVRDEAPAPALAEPRFAGSAAFALSVRGALPSTLQAQAERIARGQVTVETAHQSPVPAQVRSDTAALPAGVDSSGAGFAVQVGAFSSESEARRKLQSALDHSGGVLDGRLPTTQPVQLSGRQLYRARFSGFDSLAAAAACQELRRRQIDCHVARVE